MGGEPLKVVVVKEKSIQMMLATVVPKEGPRFICG